jgi:CRISPR/Cas system endoribonuclease Cas6 (RAMP superfamily)
MTTTLPIARYQFDFEVETSIRLPEYAGSTLRGAFGQALRHIACMTRQKDCKTCPLYRSCPYPAIFETPAPEVHALQQFSQIPNPYIIEPPAWGERIYQPGEQLSFNMVLVGRSLAQLPLITLAWQRAFAREVGHGTAKLQSIQHLTDINTTSVFDVKQQRILTHTPIIVLTPTAVTQLTLHFTSPLRIQQNGRAIHADQLTPRDLLMTLARRVSLMTEFHTDTPYKLDFSQLAEEIAVVSDHHQLQWRDWTRYSSRQHQAMQLGGVVGEWLLNNLSPALTHLLQIGRWMHIGKNATFGLGGYTIK